MCFVKPRCTHFVQHFWVLYLQIFANNTSTFGHVRASYCNAFVGVLHMNLWNK